MRFVRFDQAACVPVNPGLKFGLNPELNPGLKPPLNAPGNGALPVNGAFSKLPSPLNSVGSVHPFQFDSGLKPFQLLPHELFQLLKPLNGVFQL